MNTQKRYPPELRERAVRPVEEQQKEGVTQWSAMQSISKKLGCTPETLRRWVRQRERHQGKRAGPTTAEAEELKRLRSRCWAILLHLDVAYCWSIFGTEI